MLQATTESQINVPKRDILQLDIKLSPFFIGKGKTFSLTIHQVSFFLSFFCSHLMKLLNLRRFFECKKWVSKKFNLRYLKKMKKYIDSKSFHEKNFHAQRKKKDEKVLVKNSTIWNPRHCRGKSCHHIANVNSKKATFCLKKIKSSH